MTLAFSGVKIKPRAISKIVGLDEEKNRRGGSARPWLCRCRGTEGKWRQRSQIENLRMSNWSRSVHEWSSR